MLTKTTNEPAAETAPRLPAVARIAALKGPGRLGGQGHRGYLRDAPCEAWHGGTNCRTAVPLHNSMDELGGRRCERPGQARRCRGRAATYNGRSAGCVARERGADRAGGAPGNG